MKNKLLICIVLLMGTLSCQNLINNTNKSDHPEAKISVTFPSPQGWVNDYERLLTPMERAVLSDKIDRYYQKTSRAIAVVSIANIDPYTTPKSYTLALTTHWGVGSKIQNNSLCLFLSKNLDTTVIATGKETQKSITDSIAQQIINTKMLPHFKNGHYAKGLNNAIDALVKVWE